MNTVTTDQVERMLEGDDALVVSVLGEEEFERAHIPGSVNIPVDVDDFVDRVSSRVNGRDSTVVVYCAGPQCEASPTAAKVLDEAGFDDVHAYEGGMKAWIEARNEVEREGHGD